MELRSGVHAFQPPFTPRAQKRKRNVLFLIEFGWKNQEGIFTGEPDHGENAEGPWPGATTLLLAWRALQAGRGRT